MEVQTGLGLLLIGVCSLVIALPIALLVRSGRGFLRLTEKQWPFLGFLFSFLFVSVLVYASHASLIDKVLRLYLAPPVGGLGVSLEFVIFGLSEFFFLTLFATLILYFAVGSRGRMPEYARIHRQKVGSIILPLVLVAVFGSLLTKRCGFFAAGENARVRAVEERAGEPLGFAPTRVFHQRFDTELLHLVQVHWPSQAQPSWYLVEPSQQRIADCSARVGAGCRVFLGRLLCSQVEYLNFSTCGLDPEASTKSEEPWWSGRSSAATTYLQFDEFQDYRIRSIVIAAPDGEPRGPRDIPIAVLGRFQEWLRFCEHRKQLNLSPDWICEENLTGEGVRLLALNPRLILPLIANDFLHTDGAGAELYAGAFHPLLLSEEGQSNFEFFAQQNESIRKGIADNLASILADNTSAEYTPEEQARLRAFLEQQTSALGREFASLILQMFHEWQQGQR